MRSVLGAVFSPVLGVQGAVFGRLCLGDLALELGDLCVLFGRDAFEVALRLCEFSVLGAELFDEGGQFLRAQRCRTSGEFGIELCPRGDVIGDARVVECCPDDDEVELVESFDGGIGIDRGVFVNCGVAEVANEVELLVDDMARHRFEFRVIDAGAEVIPIGCGNIEHGVEVRDKLFDAAASINAGSAWIGEDVRFGAGAIREHRGPLGPDEPEVRHLSSYASLP